MSFLNDNPGINGSAAFSSMSRQNGVNSRNQVTGSFMSRGGGVTSRGSLSFAEGNSTLGSFVEDQDDNPNFEVSKIKLNEAFEVCKFLDYIKF